MQEKNKNISISSREMRALEINAEYFGITLTQLMENAGRNIFEEITKRFSNDKKIVLFCGLGGNGGDGFVAARHLITRGFDVTVIIAGKSKEISHPSALQNWVALQPLLNTKSMFEVSDSSCIPSFNADVIVDALLGTGTKGKLKAPILQIVECINALHGFKIAVDVPTGIDSDSGDILGIAVKADLTITFHKSKFGLEKSKKYVGELIVKDIGLPEKLEHFAGPGDVSLAVKSRGFTAHKGDFGRLLVIGGSEVFSGAPALVSLAALRTGVDIVYTAAPAKTALAISSVSPDLITIKLDGSNIKLSNVTILQPYLDQVDAVVIGPGLGLNAESIEFVKVFVNTVEKAGKPLLLDADGLKAFAKFKRPLKIPLVLTPHAGEYTILTGEKLPEDSEEKIEVIKRTAKQLNATLLVKGKIDVICDLKRTKLNFTGNAGMTVGGTGDVLSGIVGGLLAQKVDPFDAAVAGAFVNGACGDFVVSEKGFHMVASDIVELIPKVFVDPMSHLKVRKPSGN